MHRHKSQLFVSAPGQRCYYFVVHTSTIFDVHMYCSRGTEGNGQRAGVGDRTQTPERIPIILDPSLAHRHRTHVVRRRVRAERRRKRTSMAYLAPDTWYQVSNRGPYPRVSMRLDGPTMCLHIRTSRLIPSMGQRHLAGKKRLEPTTLPVTVHVHT